MCAAGLYLLLEEHLDRFETVIIDVEYEGWEGVIKGLLLRHMSGRRPDFFFQSIGKKSPAHNVAWLTYRGKRKPDRIVQAQELLEYC